MNAKSVQNIILSETRKKLKITKYNNFNNKRRTSMKTMKKTLRRELKQMVIFV